MTYAQLPLSTATTEVILSMDLMSGGKMERYQVSSPEQTNILNQLTDLTIKKGNSGRSSTIWGLDNHVRKTRI